MPAQVSVVIVNHNTKSFLERCLNSLYSNSDKLRLEVIVVDNASADGSEGMVASLFPGVKLIKNNSNVGFAKAVNQGIKISASLFLLLLNSDTIVKPGSLRNMIRVMEAHEDAGAIGGRLVGEDGIWQKWTAGYKCSLWNVFCHYFFLSHCFNGRFPFEGMYIYSEPSAPIRVAWVGGGFVLLRRLAIDKIGGFDEAYFMYGEDVELCERLKRNGWKVYYNPTASVVHAHGGTLRNIKDDETLRKIRHSKKLYLRRQMGYGFQAARLIIMLGLGIRWVLYRSAHIVSGNNHFALKSQEMQMHLKTAF